LGRALMHEHPEHRCALVDVDPHDDAHATARQLAREISHDTGEDQVAYRGGDRFAARLVELDRQLVPRGQRRPAITGHGTYVVTGGLGSLGLRCARWMAEQGARRLVLIGRSEPSAAARAGVAGIAQLGTEVLIGHADVADEAALLACLRSFDDPRHPVRGIVHAAGVLDDAPLRALDVAGLERVIGPKARGAWNLHRFSLDQPVDLFVLFSSAVAILGSPGQGNYAAASAFLDGLAHARSAGGLPAVSINWGPWSQVGLASAPDRIRFVSAHGVTPITPERGVALLAEALDAGRTQVVAINFDPRARSERSARLARWPLLSRLAGADGNGHGSGSSREPAGEVRRTILALPFGIARMAAMQAHVQNHIARVLRVPVSQIDADMPLRTLGLDSMMAVELRDHLEASLGVTLSATVVWSYPTLQQLAVNLLERIDPAAPSPDQPITSPAAAFVADEFAGLTEDQLASLLSTDLRALDERV
jgi:acyl carrier protein